jgi:hypothetical protein
VVLPRIASYATSEILVEPQELVMGSDDKELRYNVTPSYRAGTLITVALPRNVYVGGVLVTAEGEPIAYELGQWRRTDGEPGEPESADNSNRLAAGEESSYGTGEFFTDAQGYFEIYNLPPGAYEITLAGRPQYRSSFSIPNDAEEYVNLETLTPGGAP